MTYPPSSGTSACVGSLLVIQHRIRSIDQSTRVFTVPSNTIGTCCDHNMYSTVHAEHIGSRLSTDWLGLLTLPLARLVFINTVCAYLHIDTNIVICNILTSPAATSRSIHTSSIFTGLSPFGSHSLAGLLRISTNDRHPYFPFQSTVRVTKPSESLLHHHHHQS